MRQGVRLVILKFTVFSFCKSRLNLRIPHLLSPERTKLKDTEYPLVSRLLHGPCEKIARMFIMEKDLGEEITYDVSISKFTIGHSERDSPGKLFCCSNIDTVNNNVTSRYQV